MLSLADLAEPLSAVLLDCAGPVAEVVELPAPDLDSGTIETFRVPWNPVRLRVTVQRPGFVAVDRISALPVPLMVKFPSMEPASETLPSMVPLASVALTETVADARVEFQWYT